MKIEPITLTNEEIQNLLNAIHSQGRSVREVTELLEKNII